MTNRSVFTVSLLLKFFGFEPKFQSFKVCTWALLSSLQLLIDKDRPKLNSDFSVHNSWLEPHYGGKELSNQTWLLNWKLKTEILGWKSRFLTQKWCLISQISKLKPWNSHFWFTLKGPLKVLHRLVFLFRLLHSSRSIQKIFIFSWLVNNIFLIQSDFN